MDNIPAGRIALHEAAHAIAALAFRVKVKTLVLGRTERFPDFAGFCECAEKCDGWTEAVINAAGEAADEKFFGIAPVYDSNDHRRMRRAVYRIADVNPGEIEQVLPAVAEAREAAKEVLLDNRAALFRLAVELERMGSLDGEQAAHIAGGLLVPGPSRQRWQAIVKKRQERLQEIFELHRREEKRWQERLLEILAQNLRAERASASRPHYDDRQFFIRPYEGRII